MPKYCGPYRYTKRKNQQGSPGSPVLVLDELSTDFRFKNLKTFNLAVGGNPNNRLDKFITGCCSRKEI
jgi:hypothetical protein